MQLARAALALFTVGLSLALATAHAQAAPPHHFVGLQGWDDPTGADLARLERANVHSYRLNLRWRKVERVRGHYDWSYYDALFLRAARAEVRILPVFLSSPDWVCNPTCAGHRPQYPPRTDAHRKRFNAFVFEAARRYGPNGYFWRGTNVPRLNRLKWFQVWNEPNLPNYWNDAADPEEYGVFLRQASGALHRADPETRALAAGLPQPRTNGRDILMPVFIRRMLSVRGVASAVDGVAVHPYAKEVPYLFARLDEARQAMRDALRGSTKPLFITEFGWATGGDNTTSTTLAGQARRLREAYRQLLDRRAYYRLHGAYWFSYRDGRPKPSSRSWAGWYKGLFDRNDQPKPSWREYKRIAGGSS